MRAIVISPEGHAKFDADLHPDHKRLMLGDLIEMGHTLGDHVVHEDGSAHVVLLAGPHSKAEQDKRRDAAAKARPAVTGGGKAKG